MRRDDWGFSGFAAEFGPKSWGFCWPPPGRGRGSRRRRHMFEAGDMKYVILRLIREKPRHGYEIIKALEEKLGGWYSPSAGTVYPTLQLLEDQGFVRIVETEGKKVYHITAEGEAFLEDHRDVLEDILDRVRDAVRDLAGGSMGEMNEVFARMAKRAYRQAWRGERDDPKTTRVLEILQRALAEIEEALA